MLKCAHFNYMRSMRAFTYDQDFAAVRRAIANGNLVMNSWLMSRTCYIKSGFGVKRGCRMRVVGQFRVVDSEQGRLRMGLG